MLSHQKAGRVALASAGAVDLSVCCTSASFLTPKSRLCRSRLNRLPLSLLIYTAKRFYP